MLSMAFQAEAKISKQTLSEKHKVETHPHEERSHVSVVASCITKSSETRAQARLQLGYI
jgi:hypothetical protein